MDQLRAMGMTNFDFNALNHQNAYFQHPFQGYHGGGDQFQLADPNLLAANMQLNQSFMHNPMSNNLDSIIPPNDQNMNYYQEYCKLFIANVVLTNQMKELIAEKNELVGRINELEKRGGDKVEKTPITPNLNNSSDDKKTRIRRKAAEIERHYRCPITTCQKSYGSEGSLIQHIRLKHPELTDDPDWKMKILKIEGEGSNKD